MLRVNSKDVQAHYIATSPLDRFSARLDEDLRHGISVGPVFVALVVIADSSVDGGGVRECVRAVDIPFGYADDLAGVIVNGQAR